MDELIERVEQLEELIEEHTGDEEVTVPIDLLASLCDEFRSHMAFLQQRSGY